MVQTSGFTFVQPASAGSHGQRFSDRGLFSCAIPQGQSHVINLDGTRRHRCLVRSKIVVTRPPPILPPLHQPFLHGIQVHVLQTLIEFLLVADKAIPMLTKKMRSVRRRRWTFDTPADYHSIPMPSRTDGERNHCGHNRREVRHQGKSPRTERHCPWLPACWQFTAKTERCVS